MIYQLGDNVPIPTRARGVRGKNPLIRITINSSAERFISDPNQFDNLSADEIAYVLNNADDPELMGAAFRSWLRRGTKKARAVLQKVKKKIIPKRKPQSAASKARRKKIGRIASMFVPGVAVVKGAQAAAKAIKKKRVARLKKQRQRIAQKKVAQSVEQSTIPASIVSPESLPKNIIPFETTAAITNNTVFPQSEVVEEQPKKMSPLIPIAAAAMAIPFFLGK